MRAPVFTGSAVAVVTPYRNDAVDFEKLGELVEFHINNKTDAIVICGTSGEASTQTIPEHLETVAYCIKKAAGRIKVIAGTGSNDTRHALELSQEAEKLGADAVLVVTPYYNKATQKGLIRHYTYIADNINIPIILYNVPSRTGMTISVDTYKELAKHPNINGVKEASGDLSLIAKIRAACPDDFYVWSGNDDQVLPILSLGGKGVISVAANILPQEMHKMCELWFEGKVQESMKMQLDYLEFINAMFIEVNPIPVKVAMNMCGFDVGDLRMPLCEMSDENAAKLRRVLIKYNLIKE